MTTTPWRGALLLGAALLLASPPDAPAQNGRALRGEDGLVAAYESILDARFDRVEADLTRACGPAPPEACEVLAATALWWRILIDPESRALDAAFSDAVERAIRNTDAWTRRLPRDAEAWFYLGGAYGARVQWRVLRNEKLAAGRDAKRIRDALERALALAPDLADAHFGIGMYKYYADVAPAAVKWLRFLLLLPGGDRTEGLAEMTRARNEGRLMRGEADYQLHIVYLWYERQTPEALRRLQRLAERYPGNPLFVSQAAEIEDTYAHDITASLATWRTLLRLAQDMYPGVAGLARVQARLGIARQLDALHQTDHAIEQLQAVVASRPDAPYASLSLAYLRLGEAHDRLGARAAAVEAYRAAIDTARTPDPYDVARQAGERLRRAPDRQHAEAYRLSLDGWRRLERNDLTGAGAALARSLELNGTDPVTHYRYGRLSQARTDDRGAIAQLEMTIRHARTCPAPILGAAYLDLARMHERAGRRDQAIAHYRTASSLFGAAGETHVAATRALARLDATR